MRVGMDADGGQLQLRGQGPAIERLDVHQLVLEAVLAGGNLLLGQGIEHEGIVRVGAVTDADRQAGIVHFLGLPRLVGHASKEKLLDAD